MNSVFSNKTRRPVVITVAKLFVLVLIALACVVTPLTAFACDGSGSSSSANGVVAAIAKGLSSKALKKAIKKKTVSKNGLRTTNVSRAQFATMLKGFCQAFEADLRARGITDKQLDLIKNQGQSVKQVLETKHSNRYPDDQSVNTFEKNEIEVAENDFLTNNGTYAPDACGLSNRNQQKDSRSFQSFFNSTSYQKLDIGSIDSMFTNAVRAVPAQGGRIVRS